MGRRVSGDHIYALAAPDHPTGVLKATVPSQLRKKRVAVDFVQVVALTLGRLGLCISVV